ncbi:glycoside hydrolase family 5 protein [Botryobasidium botryosum FD-172 SS1]|uniref:mannan endo-1,4-beta-mannosidase n=1 Tax=Botryobasidium botryosum (strain FD-172 SS1) TaxID=930990 RepID=A0A067N3V1_BOTB1|nr:glycoside hydrolase family 5 protein [Botryobasidium botryosum FD-172 SS1]
MRFASRLSLAALLLPLAVAASASTPTPVKRGGEPGFVSSQNGQFLLDGKPFLFTATNAYWLHHLDQDSDIDKTFTDIANAGLKVVKTWAFDDVVGSTPPPGTFFQLFNGANITINEAGLQRLDAVVASAEKHNIKLILTLSNNWFPTPPDHGDTKPRGFLSNSYGGADVYVQQLLGPHATHDEFFSNPIVIAAFKNYVKAVVSRYINSPAIFSYELMQDPRCFSTLPASPACSAQTITLWHAEISKFIKDLDCNHMAGSGDGGFFCVGCPKLFPPPAAPSPKPGQKRGPGLLTLSKLRAARTEIEKRAYARSTKEARKRGSGGAMVRARWSAPATAERAWRRQSDSAAGPGYDGSQGVDSEDISGISSIDYSGFQYFPDQNSYGPVGMDSARRWEQTQQLIDSGNLWIQQHLDTANTFQKPSAFTGFGILSQENLPFFVPPNSTTVVAPPNPGDFIPNSEVATVYKAWLDTCNTNKLPGLVQYQWSEHGLCESNKRQSDDASVFIGGNSPNDGYAADVNVIAALSDTASQQSGYDD